MRYTEQLRKLNKLYTPQERGFCSKEEIELITGILQLNTLDIDGLRNMRDMTVLFLSPKKKQEYNEEVMVQEDKVSAICAVIDNILFKKGEEV